MNERGSEQCTYIIEHPLTHLPQPLFANRTVHADGSLLERLEGRVECQGELTQLTRVQLRFRARGRRVERTELNI